MNWSMRQNSNQEAIEFAKELKALFIESNSVELVILPSMGTIYSMAEVFKDSQIEVGGQTISQFKHGAYSGEYSIEALMDIGGKYVALGHWERRSHFGETEEIINEKLHLALENAIRPILCIGEKEKHGDIQDIDYQYVYLAIKRQIFNGIFNVRPKQLKEIVFAYTPRWAIGQSAAASRDHIHQVARLIRQILGELYEEQLVAGVQLVYGGTVSYENTKWITASKDIDGVLIGRFGSDPKQIMKIVNQLTRLEE